MKIYKASILLILTFFSIISYAETAINATVISISVSQGDSITKSDIIVNLNGLFASQPLPKCV